MKCIFLGKRGRPDIHTGTNFLSTRVRELNTGDWKKLIRLLSYLKESKSIRLNFDSDDTQTLYWHNDSSFGTHND